MARTVRTPARQRRSYWTREAAGVRRVTRRRHRHTVRAALRRGDHDTLPIVRSTQGWITW